MGEEGTISMVSATPKALPEIMKRKSLPFFKLLPSVLVGCLNPSTGQLIGEAQASKSAGKTKSEKEAGHKYDSNWKINGK